MKVFRIIILFVALGLVASQAEAKKTKLVYQLKPGDQFKIEIVQNQETAQEIMGQSQGMTSESAMEYDLRVTSVTQDGNFKIEFKVIRYSMSASSPMADLKYDSDDEGEVPVYAKPLSAVLDEVFSFVLSPEGKVSDVSVPEGLEEKVRKLTEDLLPGDMQVFAGLSGNIASVDGMNRSIKNLFMKLPSNPVKTGETWTVQDQMEQIIPFSVKSDFKLVKASKEANEIHLATQITQADPSAGMEMEGVTLHYELAGAKSGSLSLDPQTGIIINGEATTAISGVISLESPQIPAPMSIPITVKSVEKIRRL